MLKWIDDYEVWAFVFVICLILIGIGYAVAYSLIN